MTQRDFFWKPYGDRAQNKRHFCTDSAVIPTPFRTAGMSGRKQ